MLLTNGVLNDIYANIDLLSFWWVKIVKKYATSEVSISSVPYSSDPAIATYWKKSSHIDHT